MFRRLGCRIRNDDLAVGRGWGEDSVGGGSAHDGQRVKRWQKDKENGKGRAKEESKWRKWQAEQSGRGRSAAMALPSPFGT